MLLRSKQDTNRIDHREPNPFNKKRPGGKKGREENKIVTDNNKNTLIKYRIKISFISLPPGFYRQEQNTSHVQKFLSL
jgi:hypothetical protein